MCFHADGFYGGHEDVRLSGVGEMKQIWPETWMDALGL